MIWHVGPFATINGARLGSQAPALPPDLIPYSGDASDASWHASSTSNGHHSLHHHPQDNSHHVPSVKVPWSENNAALGYLVMLLQVLTEAMGWTLRHPLQPMASHSQIGIRKPMPVRRSLFSTAATVEKEETTWQAPAWQNLFYSEDQAQASFALFGGGQSAAAQKQQLQSSMVGLVENLLEIQKQTRVVFPHAMQVMDPEVPPGPRWVRIGGLALQWVDDSMETPADLTKACKYLLTNMKWLLSYAVQQKQLQSSTPRNIDRPANSMI
mmetsp:Transcript_7989/g.22814  ORF Transcript_7989/g.22814 Transcript_7989/m.22814 type:complete len:269 (-) Transcript_7989:1967-2773(-)